MLRNIFLFFLSFMFLTSEAQQSSLMVNLDDQNKPFLNHVVGVKENFYSIGRMYNISPRVFAPYNGLDLTSGLSIGQTIRIPLNEMNFWQTGSRKGKETVVPVYHQVQAKETLTGISKMYNIDKASLTSWNNIEGEKISVGGNLIIGFLTVDKTLSPLAAQGMGPRSEPPVPKPVQPVTPAEDKTPKVTVKQPEKESKPTTTLPANDKKAEQSVPLYSGNGFFKEEYDQQTSNDKNIQKSSLKGGSFKSTSGWSDGKYYILIDGIEKGTIVRLRHLTNNKFIYAKVLASISETKPGAVERFLISNSAAAQLNVSGSDTEIEISWVK